MWGEHLTSAPESRQKQMPDAYDLKEGSAKEPESISFRLWRPYSQNYSTLPR